MTPRAVFDCMVFLQAFANGAGPAAACLDLVEGGSVGLCVSPAVLDELRDVAGRPGVRKRLRTLTDEVVEAGLHRLTRLAVMIPDAPTAVRLSRDVKDEKYLNLAVAASATIVVSRDKDLLNLMTGTDPDAEAFRTAYPDIAILDPVAFLRTIRQPAPQDRPTSEA